MSEWQETEYGKAPLSWSVLPLAEMAVKITDGAHLSPKPQMAGKYMCSVKDMTYDRFNLKASKLISEEDYVKLVKQGCQPKKEDILISKDGANCLDLIFVYKQKEELVLLSSIAIVRLKPEYIPDFVRYFLLSPDCQYTMRNNYVSGSAIPRVVLKDFKRVPILVPPLNEQRSIASVLSSLDDKIDLLHRQNKTLEAMAETLFRQWFVEGVGDWEERQLKEVLDISIGRTPPRQEHQWFSKNSNDYKWISIKDMGSDGAYIFRTSECLTRAAIDKFNIAVIPKDTVVLSFKMTLGRVAITTEDMLSNEAIAHFVFKETTPFTVEYLYVFLKNYKYEILGSTSSIVTAINSAMIKDMVIPIPDKQLMDNFDSAVSVYFKKIRSNQIQISKLEKIRNELLPKLMSGEVRVS